MFFSSLRRFQRDAHLQIPNPNATGPAEVWTCCSADDDGAVEMLIDMIAADQLCEPPVSMVRQKSEERPSRLVLQF